MSKESNSSVKFKSWFLGLLGQSIMRKAKAQALLKLNLLLALHLAFFMFLRVLFLSWNWVQFKSMGFFDILRAFGHGFRFDLSAAMMILSPWLLLTLTLALAEVFLPQGKLRMGLVRVERGIFGAWSFVVYTLVTLPLWILNIIDLEFVNFVGRRFTWASLFIFREFRGGGAQSFILPYWYWIILEIIGLIFLYRYQWKIWIREESPAKPGIWVGFLPVILVLAVVGVRGGLQKKPLSFVQANIFLAPVQNNLVLNSSFTVLRSLKKPTLVREVFFSDPEEMKSLLNGASLAQAGEKGSGIGSGAHSVLEGHRTWKKPNVVILILESFALEYMGTSVNASPGFTPFLDELSKRALFFRHAFANGRRSIEGIAAIYAGIPSLMEEPFISSQFSANHFMGLGSLLAREGYHTSFFHGAENGSMYFDSFMKTAGVENYFGAREYPNPKDHDGAWGIFDEPFFHFFGEKLTSFPQPFFAGIFSLSSHPPYVIPEKYKKRFPPGPIEIAPSISYTDFALREFFQGIESKPWYNNTVFILTADHTQKNFRPEYNNILGQYRVPLLIFAPGFQWPEVLVNTKQLAQHIDIFPTILDILDIKTEASIWLGRSLFVPGEKTITNYLEPGFILVSDQNYLLWNRPEPAKLYSSEDPSQKKPLLDQPKVQEHLENRLKASLQYFSQGLWDQKLYTPSR